MSNRVREIRESRGWSQVALAKKLDISQAALYNIESGITKIKKWEERLCTALDCTVEQLLGTDSLPHEIDEKRVMKDSMLMVYDYFAKRKIDVEQSRIAEVATELVYIIKDLEYKKKNHEKEKLLLMEEALKEKALVGLAADCLLGSKYYQKNKP